MRRGLSFFLFFLISACSFLKTENNSDVLFEIKKGENFSSVVKRLKEERIVSNPFLFRWQARITGSLHKLKFGIYQIKAHESYSSVIKKFYNGKSFAVNLTIPEGYNIFEIAELLESKNLIKKELFLSELKNPELLRYLNLPPSASMEGYLFPDSYSIPLNYSGYQIVKIFLDRFKEIVNEEILNMIRKRGLNLKEILTMASIIEKEAKFDFEKPIISGVYYNRIRKGYRLQADPTLIYALMLDNKYDGNIRKRDFEYDSRYNTYKHFGLPPGPICNPGKTSILAAIFPADVEYLYFVAKPDGTHHFSKTLEEHNKAVRAFQIIPAQERRKQRLHKNVITK
ncbi:MAG: endolytic transglycosylase MltG [Brevinematia bacterium]